LHIILASGSTARKNLLEGAGLRVRVVPARIDERALQSSWPDVGPPELARRLARAKAEEVLARVGGVVIGADQVLWDGAELVGKPESAEQHADRLRRFRGRWHDLYSAWIVVAGDGATEGVGHSRLRVREDVSDAEIDRYVNSGEGSACAGGYAIEGRAAWFFEAVEGDWTNILGLPLFPVLGALRARGFAGSVYADE